MKQTIFFLFILIIYSCENKLDEKVEEQKSDSSIQILDTLQNNGEKDSTSKKEPEYDEIRDFEDFKDFKIYKLTDSIKEDFNGDGIKDIIYLEQQKDGKKVIYYNGKTKTKEKIVLDKPFEDQLEGIEWADYWGTTKDKEIDEATITEDGDLGDGRVAKTDNISLFFRKFETGGGVVTYKNKLKKFIWLHQSC